MYYTPSHIRIIMDFSKIKMATFSGSLKLWIKEADNAAVPRGEHGSTRERHLVEVMLELKSKNWVVATEEENSIPGKIRGHRFQGNYVQRRSIVKLRPCKASAAVISLFPWVMVGTVGYSEQCLCHSINNIDRTTYWVLLTYRTFFGAFIILTYAIVHSILRWLLLEFQFYRRGNWGTGQWSNSQNVHSQWNGGFWIQMNTIRPKVSCWLSLCSPASVSKGRSWESRLPDTSTCVHWPWNISLALKSWSERGQSGSWHTG